MIPAIPHMGATNRASGDDQIQESDSRSGSILAAIVRAVHDVRAISILAAAVTIGPRYERPGAVDGPRYIPDSAIRNDP